MADIIHLRTSAHDEVQRLIPWLVNGTLTDEEKAMVDDHLAECAECRADVQSERQLAEACASMPVDIEAGWESMERMLEADRPVVIGPAAWWRRKVPVGWAVASPLAAAAAMALVFVSVTPTPAPPAAQEYRALGSASTVRAANVVVMFEPTSREKDIRSTLDAADARLVDGPTETGAYLLLVDNNKREQALKSLRDSNAIALAEPIDGPTHQ